MRDPIVLTLPDDVFDNLRTVAKASELPVEQVIIDHLRTIKLLTLPPDIQTEIDALRVLSDDALWTIAREQMPQGIQARAHDLMDKNTFGTITDEEYEELGRYVERSDRLMLRKAEAAALLRERGYTFTQADFEAHP